MPKKQGGPDYWKMRALKVIHDRAPRIVTNQEMLGDFSRGIVDSTLSEYLGDVARDFPKWVKGERGRWEGYPGPQDLLQGLLRALPDFGRRWQTQREARDAVAWWAARNFDPGPGQWVAFDASATVARVAWYLWKCRRHEEPLRLQINVVTNNVAAAWCLMLLQTQPNIVEGLHVVGTRIHGVHGALEAPDEKTCLECAPPKGEHFGLALLGTNFVSFDSGLLCDDEGQFRYKTELMERATEIWVPVDHKKVGVKPDDPALRRTRPLVDDQKRWARDLRPKTTVIVDCGTDAVISSPADRASQPEQEWLEQEKTKWWDSLGEDHFRVVKERAPEPSMSAGGE